LSNAVNRVIQKSEIPGKPQLSLLREQLQHRSRINKIAITVTDGIQLVKVDDILYLKSDGNYTTVFLKNGKNILVSRQIGKFEEMLADAFFFRVHASFLINLNCVSKYVRSDGGYIVMENGENISVARNRKDDFLNMIGKV
jgi:two-component system LytT family response regulator